MSKSTNKNTNPTPTGNNSIVIESAHDGSCTRSSSSGHIRPKVRRRGTTTETSKTVSTTTITTKGVSNKDGKETNVDELLEQTRLYMSRVLRPTETNGTSSSSFSNAVSRPTGILKTEPRYQSGIPSSKPTMPASTTYDTDSLAKEMGLPDHDHDNNNDNNGHDKRSSKPFIKEFVVERSQPKADPLPFASSSSSVEGYSPSTTHPYPSNTIIQREVTSEYGTVSASNSTTSSTSATAATVTTDSGTPTKPLKTLSELVSLSKTLTEQELQECQQTENNHQPRTDTDKDGKSQMESFETDVEFTCMTKAQYDETVKLTHSLGVSMDEWMSSGENNDDDDNSSDPNGNNMDRGGGVGAAEEEDGSDNDNNDDDPALQDECELPTLEASPRDWNDIYFGKQSVFSDDHKIDDEYDEDGSLNDMDPSEDYYEDEEEEEEETSQPPPQPRPFMLLWNALSTWITPEAVIVLHRLKKEAVGDLTYDYLAAAADGIETNFQNQQQSVSEKGGDIGASRRAALMAMLKMNMARSLSELGCGGIDGHARRIAETKLGQFVQCFDFSESMVKFDRKIWRAMTVVLLRIVLPEDAFAFHEDLRSNGVAVDNGHACDRGGQSLPTSVQDIGITLEEYHYLTKSAIRSLYFGSA